MGHLRSMGEQIKLLDMQQTTNNVYYVIFNKVCYCLCCSTKVIADIMGWVRPGGKDWTLSRILAVTLLILERKKANFFFGQFSVNTTVDYLSFQLAWSNYSYFSSPLKRASPLQGLSLALNFLLVSINFIHMGGKRCCQN